MDANKGQRTFDLESAGNLNDYIESFNTDMGYAPQRDPEPTDHVTGSWDKVEVLAARLENSEELWSDEDKKLPRKKTAYEELTGFLIDAGVDND